jgi:hypothetical protein
MLAIITHTKTPCLHITLDNGIHHFVFSESSPAAVDAWIDALETLYRSSASDTVLRMLVDSREADVQPLHYVTRRGREVNDRYPDRPETRTAFLYRDNFSASLARTCIVMLSRIGRDSVQFFPGAEEEATALAWLLKD